MSTKKNKNEKEQEPSELTCSDCAHWEFMQDVCRAGEHEVNEMKPICGKFKRWLPDAELADYIRRKETGTLH